MVRLQASLACGRGCKRDHIAHVKLNAANERYHHMGRKLVADLAGEANTKLVREFTNFLTFDTAIPRERVVFPRTDIAFPRSAKRIPANATTKPLDGNRIPLSDNRIPANDNAILRNDKPVSPISPITHKKLMRWQNPCFLSEVRPETGSN